MIIPVLAGKKMVFKQSLLSQSKEILRHMVEVEIEWRKIKLKTMYAN